MQFSLLFIDAERKCVQKKVKMDGKETLNQTI
jgi:hypothetical protein